MTKPTPHRQVPEALRLAEEITNLECSSEAVAKTIAAAADELCRLHVENASLRASSAASPTPPAEQQAAPKAAPQQESTASNESAYQRGYMDGMAKGRRDAETAPQPAPAPLSDDTKRLNWLLWKLPGDALRYVVGELSDTSSGAEFRAAIDAALAAQGGKT